MKSEGGARPGKSRGGPTKPRKTRIRGGPFPCLHPGCPRSFQSNSSLGRHVRDNHEPGFKCLLPGCVANYEWVESRTADHKKHLKGHHKRNDDEIEVILTQPRLRVIESDLPPSPPIDMHHASPPLMQPEPVAYYTNSALIKEIHEIHDQQLGFVHAFLYPAYMIDCVLRFQPNPGMLHIGGLPALPAQQPGTQGPLFSYGVPGFPAPQASYHALPPPTQQTPPIPSEDMWDDTYLALLGTQDPRQLRELLARAARPNPEVDMPLEGQSPLSQGVILALVHRVKTFLRLVIDR
jgi:hypothetical protein